MQNSEMKGGEKPAISVPDQQFEVLHTLRFFKTSAD